MVILYRKDCPPSDKVYGASAHDGDSQLLHAYLQSDDNGLSWRLSRFEFNTTAIAGFPNLQGSRHEWTSKQSDGMKHLVVYVSEGKHWAYPNPERCRERYHAGTREDCDSDDPNDKILVEYGAQYDAARNRFARRRLGNIGEPPHAYRIYYLENYGFDREATFDGSCFCGGYRANSGRKSTAAYYNSCEAVQGKVKHWCADPVGSKWYWDEKTQNTLLAPSPKKIERIFNLGQSWNRSTFPTSLAFGNLDSDPQAEIVVGLSARSGNRLFVYDDARNGFDQLFAFPAGAASDSEQWGDSAYVTSVATGDIDGDGRDEIIVGRYLDARNKYTRLYIFDDAGNRFRGLAKSGGWGASCTTSALATGDIDGDRVDEILVGRRCGELDAHKKPRYFFYEYASGDIEGIYQGGGDWGRSAYPTSIAAADFDGDGRDEIVVGRWKESKNPAYHIHDDRQAGFALMNENGPNGSGWGEDNYVTKIAAGDLDGDGRAEVGIGRKTRGSAYNTMKFQILTFQPAKAKGRDGATGGRVARFETLHVGGAHWGRDNFTTALGFGNIDADPELEIGMGRRAGSGMRYVFMDDRYHFSKRHIARGHDWPRDREVGCIAFGDVDGDGSLEAGIAIRETSTKMNKLRILRFNEP
jgi:hypothetical protein